MAQQPATQDFAYAEAFVAVEYDENETISREWLKLHRAALVRQVATWEMQKREAAEFAAEGFRPVRRAA